MTHTSFVFKFVITCTQAKNQDKSKPGNAVKGTDAKSADKKIKTTTTLENLEQGGPIKPPTVPMIPGQGGAFPEEVMQVMTIFVETKSTQELIKLIEGLPVEEAVKAILIKHAEFLFKLKEIAKEGGDQTKIIEFLKKEKSSLKELLISLLLHYRDLLKPNVDENTLREGIKQFNIFDELEIDEIVAAFKG